MVSDVSVEVALLARLHGVPVVGVAMPGDRSDPGHRLGYGIATELIGCWPREAPDMIRGLAPGDASRLRLVGGLSRFPVATPRPRRPGPPRVTVLLGRGGSELTDGVLERARSQTPSWEWTCLGGPSGGWSPNPFDLLCDADVVVTHAGENAVAEVAAARRPCVVVPSRRPHDEQLATAQALQRGSWPALVVPTWSHEHWAQLLDGARALDGEAWSTWCDGHGARRFAQIVEGCLSESMDGAA
jgi:hypothetical protein